MTQAELDRMDVLSAKMDAAANRAGRTWTDTADLSDRERADWRRLVDKASDALEQQMEQQAADAANGQLAAMLGGPYDGRIGVQSDAAW